MACRYEYGAVVAGLSIAGLCGLIGIIGQLCISKNQNIINIGPPQTVPTLMPTGTAVTEQVDKVPTVVTCVRIFSSQLAPAPITSTTSSC
ncbi:MAG: hypothetical protein WCO06_02195 [Candidatus Roizmanbacteria bacterium]